MQTLRHVLILFFAFAFAACGRTPEPVSARGEPVHGSLADVKTRSGHYAGYDVERGCGQERNRFVVIGTGSIEFHIYGSDDDRLRAELRGETQRLDFRGPPIRAHTSGSGVSCHGGKFAEFIITDDFREIDTAVRSFGEAFAAGDYRGEVDLFVSPRAVGD